jgi:hypothetical protein
MTHYGDPSRPNKYEIEASDMIHKVGLAIEHRYPTTRIHADPNLYYDTESRPSRILEVWLNHNLSIRVGVERQSASKRRAKWTCYWTVFAKGTNIAEGQFDATGISQVTPEITEKVVGRYAYAIAIG